MNRVAATSGPMLFALVLVSGCSVIEGTIPSVPSHTPSNQLRGGAGIADITPPPGYPMGGHSSAGQVAYGQWLRLKVRAFYLEDATGGRMALVIADLWSMPAGLADRAAERIVRGENRCGLTRETLLVAATHTHQSPGNFSSSILYNFFGSPKVGFDPDLFEFLAERFQFAVEQACNTQGPVQLSYQQEVVSLLARNRSFHAFVKNPEHESILTGNHGLETGCPDQNYPEVCAFRAVDPTLTTLKLEAVGTGNLIGVIAFFAAHPTSLNHEAKVYSSDFFGYAAHAAESRLARGEARPIVAIFNGAEGDVSPYWKKQDRRDTEALGTLLAKAIAQGARQSGRSTEGPIEVRFGRYPLPDQCLGSPPTGCNCTDSRMEIGAGALSGAEDGRTNREGWHEGMTGPKRPFQGRKIDGAARFFGGLPVTGVLNAILAGPEVAPLGIYRIGSVSLIALPGEFTTVMGKRVVDQAAHAMMTSGQAAPDVILVVGLANEYISYFATPEEYAAQHYEGAFTLYGPASGPVLALDVADLVDRRPAGQGANKSALGQQAHESYHYRYTPGLVRRFHPKDLARHRDLGTHDYSYVWIDPHKITPLGDPPTFCWYGPDRESLANARRRPYESPRVAIDRIINGNWTPYEIGGIAQDDEGPNFLTVVRSATGGTLRWCSYWIAPQDVIDGAGREYRFHVRHQQAGDYCSDPGDREVHRCDSKVSGKQ